MSQKVLAFLFVLALSLNSLAQTATPTPDESAAKLEKDALEMLREASADVGRLRTPENRISFSSELASLMWFHDEREAKSMYSTVVIDFKQLIGDLDAQMNSSEGPNEEDYSGGLFFGYSARSKAERKLRSAMEVRKQVAMSLAEHAPELAFNFFYDTRALITNAKFRDDVDRQDKRFEGELLQQIAASDAAKAAALGTETMKRSLEPAHVSLLRKIYSKDQSKGVEFGAALLSRMKSERSNLKSSEIYTSLLRFGESNLEAVAKDPSKKTVYTRNDLRDIADQFGSAVLDGLLTESYGSPIDYADTIEKYAPGRAAQIRSKFKEKGGTGNSYRALTMAMNTAANVVPARGSSSGTSADMSAAANVASAYEREEREREAKAKAERDLMEGIKSLGTKQMPKEERDKFIADSRRIISQTKGVDKKVVALGMLAAQVAKAGDKDLAAQIMTEAERLVEPQPVNYRDFMLSWMLVSSYAEVDPEKAFPLLENTVLRANETIGAFVKVAEFIDVNGEIADNGEILVGMFGGTMVKGLTGEIGMAGGTLRSLAKADLTRVRSITNTFERPEARILAKLMVLRAVLDKKTKTLGSDGEPDIDLLD